MQSRPPLAPRALLRIASRRGSPPAGSARSRRQWGWPCALGAAAAIGLGLSGCPAPAAAPITPIAPEPEPEEIGQCAQGEDDTTGHCTPEGCVSPPDPEEGSGGAGSEDDLDCSRWDS